MLVYWSLFAYFAFGTLLTRPVDGTPPRWISVPLLLGAAAICLAIGLRYKVGADWETYKFLFSFADFAKLDRVLRIGDPGYQFLNWTIQHLDGEIWQVNLICGLIFSWGLFRLARAQPDPWLAVVVAIPYLVVVVAMGYTRQAVAIGFLMAGLASLERGGSVLRFAVYVAAATLFHKTAVAVLPLVIFSGERNRLLNALGGIAGGLFLYDLFLADSVEGFVRNYIDRQYSSQGAAVRVAMNLVPAVCYLLSRKRLYLDPREARVWYFFSLAALVMPLLLLLLPSSTVVDRLSLYLIPLQLVILPRLQYLFHQRGLGRALVVAYSAAVLFTWLNFAVHAQYWVPYRFYPGLL